MAGEAVSIKGTKNGLVIVFNPDLDIEVVKENLKLKMETSKGFFKGAKFIVYDSPGNVSRRHVSELEGICRQYGLIPSGDVSWPPPAYSDELSETAQKRKKTRVIPIRQQTKPDGEKALLVTRTLRSGQKIYSQNNIVIMADVNPGAEVVSEGNIYIMGNCKGSVHAGSTGNIMSEVFAMMLQPIILRIGSVTAGTACLTDHAFPVVARVIRGEIMVNKFIP